MPSDRVPSPWRSFLADIDSAATTAVDLHCIGGFAVTMHYALQRATGDLDLLEVVPRDRRGWLTTIAGRGSELHRKHRVHVQFAGVAQLPEGYLARLAELFSGEFHRLRLFVPDPYDLVLSKLSRNFGVDIEDARHIARLPDFDLTILEARYFDELRLLLQGPVERHDMTLTLWLEAMREDREKGPQG